MSLKQTWETDLTGWNYMGESNLFRLWWRGSGISRRSGRRAKAMCNLAYIRLTFQRESGALQTRSGVHCAGIDTGRTDRVRSLKKLTNTGAPESSYLRHLIWFDSESSLMSNYEILITKSKFTHNSEMTRLLERANVFSRPNLLLVPV